MLASSQLSYFCLQGRPCPPLEITFLYRVYIVYLFLLTLSQTCFSVPTCSILFIIEGNNHLLRLCKPCIKCSFEIFICDLFGCVGSQLRPTPSCHAVGRGGLPWRLRLSCPEALWDLSSPTRDRTHVPYIARQILNCWTTRGVPCVLF